MKKMTRKTATTSKSARRGVSPPRATRRAKPAATPVAAPAEVTEPTTEVLTEQAVPSPAAGSASAGSIDLGVSCTVHEAAALRQSCLDALGGKARPVIDGTRVERVDTAGLQVLVAFAIDCMERQIDFAWAGRSPALSRGVRLLGVDALLESPGMSAMSAGALV